jgi:hypothetical protein
VTEHIARRPAPYPPAGACVTQEADVTTKDDFNRRARRTALLTLALAAALVFGIIVLAGEDWIPGGIIVAASAIGLARQIPVIAELCKGPASTPPRGTPTS